MRIVIGLSVLNLFLSGCGGSQQDIMVIPPDQVEPTTFSCFPEYSDTSTVFGQVSTDFPNGEIPACIFELKNLREFSIQGRDCCGAGPGDSCWYIREIPPAIGNLTNLEKIEIRINAIATLPPEIVNLKKLKVLDLTDNSGFRPNEALMQLTSLEELYLFGCNMDSLTVDFGRLKNLKYLGLAGNTFDEAEKEKISTSLPGCDIVF